jgi:1-acyl-sn-glycerol-3-phosphate acyltransferase
MNFQPLKGNWTSPRTWIGIAQVPFFLLLVGVPLFVCNFFQFLGIIFLLPFSKHACRSWNGAIAGFWWSSLVLWTRHVHCLQIRRSGDPLPRDKSAIVICNHIEQPDIPVVLDLAFQSGTIGGLKFFVKNELRFVPGIGWGMRMLNFLFVKRAWSEDANFVLRMFAQIADYRSPVWIVSFPEGTRIRPAKLKKSQEYARKKGLPVFENVMLPRPKGFVSTVENMRHRVDGVYDLTIQYPDGIPSIGDYIRGAIPEVLLHVRRFPMESLPSSPEDLEAWLIARFKEKDDLLAHKLGRHFSSSQ